MPPSLIVNADDLGLSLAVNRGVFAAHECGIVTSASLLVRHPAASDAAIGAERYPSLSLGLHLDLGEWRFEADRWVPVYRVVDLDDAKRIRTEAERQLGTFRRLIRRDPSHLDSHQHVHRREPARAVLSEMGRTLGVPVRDMTPDIRYVGSFYGQTGEGRALPEAITLEALLSLIQALPSGTTELGCHPAQPPLGNEPVVDTMYDHEREVELRILCQPAVLASIQRLGIELRSFADVKRAAGAAAGHASG